MGFVFGCAESEGYFGHGRVCFFITIMIVSERFSEKQLEIRKKFVTTSVSHLKIHK